MKILHVYGGNLYGGVERTLTTLARHATAVSGFEQEFGLVYPGRLAEELQQVGARVHWLGGVRASRPWQVRQARQRLAALTRELGFDVLLFHAWWPYAVFGPAAAATGTPAVLWAHDAIRRAGWLERWAAHRPPALLLANSRYTADTLPRCFGATPIIVSYLPVALDAATTPAPAALRAQWNTPGDALVILQPSRLEPWKGQELHLRALAQLRDLPRWVAWITAWPQRPKEAHFLRRLRTLATSLGIAERVRWLPQITDMAGTLAAADILCQPNTAPEPYGLVFLEALLAGVPIVATALGGALEIVDETCGILTASTPDAVAAALRRILPDDALRAEMTRHAVARGRRLGDPSARIRELATTLARLSRQNHPVATPA